MKIQHVEPIIRLTPFTSTIIPSLLLPLFVADRLRAADDRNYYLARANPLEQNIRVYRVEKGIRHLLHNFDQTIDVRQWHTLRVTHQGCRINVYYDDKQILDLCDKTFLAGTIGLWTKSDAVTYFDDLQLQYLR